MSNRTFLAALGATVLAGLGFQLFRGDSPAPSVASVTLPTQLRPDPIGSSSTLAEGLAAVQGLPMDALVEKGLLQHVAEGMRARYENLENLAFTPVVVEGIRLAEGDSPPLREVGRARVRMGRDGRIRTDVLGEDGAWIWSMAGKNGPDGQATLTEWNRHGQSLTYVGDPPHEGRSVRLREGFRPCMFGLYLESWLGGQAAPLAALSPFWWSHRITQGRYMGVETVEGRVCHVVEWRSPPGSFVARYFVDTESFLLRRYDTEQFGEPAPGEPEVLHIRRRIYRDISTVPLADDVFDSAVVQATAERVQP